MLASSNSFSNASFIDDYEDNDNDQCDNDSYFADLSRRKPPSGAFKSTKDERNSAVDAKGGEDDDDDDFDDDFDDDDHDSFSNMVCAGETSQSTITNVNYNREELFGYYDDEFDDYGGAGTGNGTADGNNNNNLEDDVEEFDNEFTSAVEQSADALTVNNDMEEDELKDQAKQSSWLSHKQQKLNAASSSGQFRRHPPSPHPRAPAPSRHPESSTCS